MNKKNSLRNVIRLGFSSFLNDTSSEMILPILPLIITGMGGGGLALGLIGGLRDSAAELLKAPIGHWSDKIKQRKIFIYAGYITSALFKLLLLFATGWQQVLVLIGMERIGKALRTAPRDALITSSTPGMVGKGFGIHRAFDNLGAIVGSVLVFYLLWQWRLSFNTIIGLSALIGFLSIMPLKKVTESTLAQKPVTPEMSLSVFSQPFTLFTIIAGLFSFGQISYMFFIMDAQATLQTKSPILSAMLLYVLFNIFYTLAAIPVGTLSDKIGRWNMLIAGYFLFTLTLANFIAASSQAAFIACFIMYGISLAIIKVLHKACTADLAPAHLKATALGTFESITGICTFGASIIAGILWQWDTHHHVFLAAAALSGIGAVLLLFAKQKLART